MILLLGMGEMLERYTRKKSLASLADQLALKVDQVWVRRGSEVVAMPLKDVTAKDRIVVRTGAKIPVDGKVGAGNAEVNQATMTGEPLPVHREAGGTVFAGTVVEDGEIDIVLTKKGGETRLNEIVRFIETSEKSKAGIQGKAEHLADAVVPFNFALAGLVYLFTRNLTRMASVLMVDYSCALKLATPLAILTAMKTGTKNGVLIKGGRYIEALSEIDTVVFDSRRKKFWGLPPAWKSTSRIRCRAPLCVLRKKPAQTTLRKSTTAKCATLWRTASVRRLTVKRSLSARATSSKKTKGWT